MQPCKINNIEYQIPISWSEVTFLKAVEVIKNVDDKAKQLFALSGIPEDVLSKVPNADVHKLFALISFTENLEAFDNDDVLEEYNKYDFGSIEYGEAEACRKLMESNETGFEVVIKQINHLVGYDITNEPFLKVIGTANFFLSKLISSIIITPSSAKMDIAMSRARQVLPDFKNLEALERTLN